MTENEIKRIAVICHEANRALREQLGETDNPTWDNAPEQQRVALLAGVCDALAHPRRSPEDSHDAWAVYKLANGWHYGSTKDEERKTHPCLVPYDQLPHEQQLKDELFLGIVRALSC